MSERLLALAAAPVARREFAVAPEPAIPPGAVVVQNQGAGFAGLDTRDPIARMMLRSGIGQTEAQTSRLWDLASQATNFAGGIRAFHGSPHDFDRFRMDRIGTGEGAQAYGHGLYFAQSEDVARSYRDALGWKGMDWDDPRNVAGFWLQANRNDPARAIRYLESALPSAGQNRPTVERAIDLLRGGGGVPTTPHAGRMYEVNLNVDPNRLLNWDAPLSRQSGEVQDAVNRVGRAVGSPLDRVTDDMQRVDYAPLVRDPQSVAALRDAGVPGIRYLDQGSRMTGDGTRNYVMFDDSLIEILRKYGFAGLGLGLGAATFGQGAEQ